MKLTELFKKKPELFEVILTPSVDQLNLARELLVGENQNLYPAALLLTDNVVELNLYHFALEHIEECGEPARDFKSKLTFAESRGLLLHEISESIGYLHHHIRNRVQHRRSNFAYGYKHKDLMHPLAIFYHELACALLHRYAKIHDKPLNALHFPLQGNLKEVLVVDMKKKIDSADKMLDWLQKHDANDGTRENVLVHAQKLVLESTNGHEQLVTKDPIPKWHEDLQALQETEQSHAAIKKFFDFAKKTSFVRDSVHHVAFVLHDTLMNNKS